MALRIHQSENAEAAKRYYTQALAQADYYGQEGRSISAWVGRGAARLGLQGEVTQEAFFSLLDNKDPSTGKRLTVRDNDDRRPGWDVVMSGPKSVSTLRAITGDERIWEAQWQSALETAEEIEGGGIRTRVRRGGQDTTILTGSLVGSLFGHDTTRPGDDGMPDMHDHFHLYVQNATWAAHEKRWQAAEMFDVYIDRGYYQAAFEARLAKKLTGLGYEIERSADGWEVKGVPQSAIDKFSRRTHEIEAEAERKGITDAVEKDKLGAKLRRKKGEELPPEELRRYWDGRLTPEERQAIHDTFERTKGGGGDAPKGPSAARAMAHAVEHIFARDSTAGERSVHAEALRFGVGSVAPEDLERERNGHGLVSVETNGRRTATVREAHAEEQFAIRFAREGRGVCDPLGGYGKKHAFKRGYLNLGQKAAVRQLLESFDRVQMLVGKAGVGKSSALMEAVEAIEAQGKNVYAFAPTTKAVNVLKREGFGNAQTVAMLLKDERRQALLAGNVLLIDEAGFLGTRTMAQVLAVAERQNARVILSGDSAQHRMPERGAALRLLEKYAGLPAASMTEIMRQEGPLKKAVEQLSTGNSEKGFDKLHAMGLIEEIPDAQMRYEKLARDYVRAFSEKKDVLAIAPTHSEGAKVVSAIRAELKRKKKLAGEEQEILRLENANLTEAQRKDAVNYREGDTVQFLQNAKGWKRGERASVLGRGEEGVRVRTSGGEEKLLPLDQAARFNLYRTKTITLTPGDKLRITQNGFVMEGEKKHRLTNGDVHTVKGFTADDRPVLENGWVLPKDFGHLSSGWVYTSHASQGETVGKKGKTPEETVHGHVFLAQAAESFPASSQAQFYVSASRARDGVHIYTDDAKGLKRAVARPDQPLSATELLEGQKQPARAKGPSMAERIHRLRYLAKAYAKMGIDHVRGQVAAIGRGFPQEGLSHGR